MWEYAMSTHDVPGYNPDNKDQLAMGCWAEHEDGSLILVEGVEGGRAIYSIFDMAADPPVEYRDAMPEDGFKKQFSYEPKASDKDDLIWTWHDKTPFPWDRIMDDITSGARHPSAAHTLTAAQHVAESLKLRARELRDIPQTRALTAQDVVSHIQKALGELPV
jgi:hypothetical protein